MSLSYVRSWISKLPKVERNRPLVPLGGDFYTPNQVLREVERGTSLGRRLQEAVTRSSVKLTAEQQRQLARKRLLQTLKGLPPEVRIATISGVSLTPKEAISEVERRTKTGRELVEAELMRLRDILRRQQQ